MKGNFTTFVFFLLSQIAFGQSKLGENATMQKDTTDQRPEKDNLNLKQKISPISNDNIFDTEGYFNWGTSLIKGDDGRYHLFYSRWKNELNFTGWLTHSEIAYAISEKPTGPWEYKGTALKGRGGKHWDAITAHNPKIKFFDGNYYLYYISTNMGDKTITETELIKTAQVGYNDPNWRILRSNQRTGVAVSNSIDGPWKRFNQPLIQPSGPITTLTVNPAIAKNKDGMYYLVVKGDKPNDTNRTRNQAISISKSPLGPFKMKPNAVIDYMDTEDMSIWFDEKRDRFYGIFHAHTYIGLVTSADGVNWEKANAYKVMDKLIARKDGESIKPDRMERPFVYLEDGKPSVLSLGVKKGNRSYSVFIPLDKN